MKKLFFSLTVIFFGFSVVAQNADKLINNYTAVKDALVSGDNKAAAGAIGVFQKTLSEEGSFELKDALLKSADEIAKAGSIDKQRAAFNDFSVNLWKVVKASKTSSPVYYQYCPMKKAYWISSTKEIRNPYYGSSMLTCGKTVETK